jgi:hypothetical protein
LSDFSRLRALAGDSWPQRLRNLTSRGSKNTGEVAWQIAVERSNSTYGRHRQLKRFYRQHRNKEVPIEVIREWNHETGKGVKPSSLALSISGGKPKEDPSIDMGM